MEKLDLDLLVSEALDLGMSAAAIISASDIETDASFRDICASNACGAYGRCWMCPPDIGDIQTLMSEVKSYSHALVFQYVSMIEDSYDFEGMTDAKKSFFATSQRIRRAWNNKNISRRLHLGVGGCGACERCAKKDGLPCRRPDTAMPSLEGYGINVSMLASSAGMKYINGANTVTYFGAVLFDI